MVSMKISFLTYFLLWPLVNNVSDWAVEVVVLHSCLLVMNSPGADFENLSFAAPPAIIGFMIFLIVWSMR